MKLSTELLFEKLQTEFTITAYGNLSSADGFLRPFLYDSKPLIDSRPIYEPLDKSKGITPGHVCLAHGKRLEEFIPHIFEEHFLVLTGTRGDVQKLSSAVFPYVVLSENTSLSSVLNFLQDIFDFYDDWSNELNTFLLKNDDITLLLHNALKIFQNPLSVISVDFSLIAETGEEKIPEKSRIFSDKEPNIDYINALTQDETYQSFCNSSTPFFFPGYITGISTLTMNIFQNGVPTHRLILYEAQKPITRGEYCLLSILPVMLNICSIISIFRFPDRQMICIVFFRQHFLIEVQTISISVISFLLLVGTPGMNISALSIRPPIWIRKI